MQRTIKEERERVIRLEDSRASQLEEESGIQKIEAQRNVTDISDGNTPSSRETHQAAKRLAQEWAKMEQTVHMRHLGCKLPQRSTLDRLLRERAVPKQLQ